MRDDFSSAEWADNHARLSDAIGALLSKMAYAFERLVAIEYDAPWERIAKRCSAHRREA